jgi:hypothetical protein
VSPEATTSKVKLFSPVQSCAAKQSTNVGIATTQNPAEVVVAEGMLAEFQCTLPLACLRSKVAI